MALFVIADLHLGRDMAMFGPTWENHREKLADHWRRVVTPGDTVLILGDISWGMRLEEALPDLEFIKSLPGIKRILKGNHDYWWQTERKMQATILDAGFALLKPEIIAGVAVCGTRGWLVPQHPLYSEATDGKVYRREVLRLEMALDGVTRLRRDEPLAVMMHYPPAVGGEITDFITVMQHYGVKDCYYGHLHGTDQERALVGTEWGLNFHLVTADYLNFTPLLVAC
ncbi:metallophosphoesterase [Moorella naiadis]|uniref:metallophosphoesterase n=1 Tax=Moorella naiadis (nom. illeg.) TaxID=3093670 RepID=UPI003D9C9373